MPVFEVQTPHPNSELSKSPVAILNIIVIVPMAIVSIISLGLIARFLWDRFNSAKEKRKLKEFKLPRRPPSPFSFSMPSDGFRPIPVISEKSPGPIHSLDRTHRAAPTHPERLQLNKRLPSDQVLLVSMDTNPEDPSIINSSTGLIDGVARNKNGTPDHAGSDSEGDEVDDRKRHSLGHPVTGQVTGFSPTRTGTKTGGVRARAPRRTKTKKFVVHNFADEREKENLHVDVGVLPPPGLNL